MCCRAPALWFPFCLAVKESLPVGQQGVRLQVMVRQPVGGKNPRSVPDLIKPIGEGADPG